MQILRLLIITGVFVNSIHAAGFTRWREYRSPEAFVEAAKAFKPVLRQADLSAYFTTRDLGQPEDPKTGSPVPAPSISACTILWSDATHTLIFATANPPTAATRSEIGVLFLLTCRHDQWQIDDLIQFTASGKAAGVTAILSASAGTGYQLDSQSLLPIVTVRECQGGRGYSDILNSSYTFRTSKLCRCELK